MLSGMKEVTQKSELIYDGYFIPLPFLDDGSISLRQDHGPAKTRTRILPSGFLWKEVPFLFTGKDISTCPLCHEYLVG